MTFNNYEDFLNWVYCESTFLVDSQIWPRLKLKETIILVDESMSFSSVMDCLHAHEEN